MNKKKLVLLLGGAAVLSALIGIYFIFRGKGKNVTAKVVEPEKPKTTTPTVNTKTTNTSVSSDFPLQLGSKGKWVILLQAMLNFLNNAKLTLDGDFGNNTKNAIVAYPPYESMAFKEYSTIKISRYDFDAYKKKVQNKYLDGFKLYMMTNKALINIKLSKYGTNISDTDIQLFTF